MNLIILILITLFIVPLLGGLFSGIDRRITARMQKRFGPPILQAFYDVIKLWNKENIVVRRSQNFYIIFYFIFTIFTCLLFFLGGDFLLVIFALTLADIFFVLGAFKASSPFSSIGAQRELIQMMSYEPIILLTAIGFYMVTNSFSVYDILHSGTPIYLYTPLIFIAFIFLLVVKFRKSPFDLSMSHHAHQELTRGIITEFSGKTLAIIELSHWYEHILLLGIVYLFFANSIALGICAVIFAYLFTILIDNISARLTWQILIKSSWLIALILGFSNIVVLYLF
jgi:ech hydrogenase subunit B